MALENFVQLGFYSKITFINIDIENEVVNFNVKTFVGKDQDESIPPTVFTISKEVEINRYIDRHFKEPQSPEYPKFCSVIDERVPQWPVEDVDVAEKRKYENLLIEYEKKLAKWSEECEIVKEEIKAEAQTKNEYDRFFSKHLMFRKSNPLECAYNYVKNHIGFAGVNDA